METAIPSARARPDPLAHPLVPALLLALYFWMALSATAGKSGTFDELPHLTAGTSFWARGDLRLQPENGWLPQAWAGLAAVAGGVEFPPPESPGWRESDVWTVGTTFLYGSRNDADALLLRARAAMAVMGVLAGLLVYAWSRRLFGPRGGLVSLVLFAFSPEMLAHGPLVTSDMTAGLFFLAATAAAWDLCRRLTPGTLARAGLACGGLALSKFSAPLLVPIAALLFAARLCEGGPLPVGGGGACIAGRGRQAGALAAAGVLVAAVAWGIVWAAYGFRWSPFRGPVAGDALFQGWEFVMQGAGPTARLARWASDHRLLPEAWAFGLAHTLHGAAARPAFLAGEVRFEGWAWFFPYAYLVKTPLPTLGVLIAAAAAAAARWREVGGGGTAALRGLRAVAPLAALGAVYGGAALASRLNIGLRHVLPVGLVLLVLAGAAGRWLDSGPRAARVGVAILLVWTAIASLAVRPHYLAYFNEIAGGPRNGYRHLVDSNLDWGQDLPGLRDRLRSNPPAAGERAFLAYFGTASPSYHGVPAEPLLPVPSFFGDPLSVPPAPLGPGLYCVSATVLQGANLQAPGPWTPVYEARFRWLHAEMAPLLAAAPDAAEWRRLRASGGAARFLELVFPFEQYRLARLCAFLRKREPDAQVGYSILIYRLSAAEVAEATVPAGAR